MLHRIETVDPITGHDIEDLTGKPYLVERSENEDLVIYFESEENRRRYLDLSPDLDNPPVSQVEQG